MRGRALAWRLAAAMALPAASAPAETLTNESIVTLARAGLGDAALIAKIRATSARFVLDTASIVELKRRGVSDNVIAAMIAAASPPSNRSPADTGQRAPGLYLITGSTDAPAYRRVMPVIAGQTRASGLLAFTLTGGLASMKMKATLPGIDAPVHSSTGRPIFHLYREPSLASASADADQSAPPPASLTLIRFRVKAAQREARVGSFNIAGTRMGVAPADRIGFEQRQIAPGVYRLTPVSPLAAGEYGFVYAFQPGSGAGLRVAGGITARVFDFAIVPATGDDPR